ncbi:MAG: MarR family transcriptional regulator, partial [Gemmatimonadales bacterium]
AMTGEPARPFSRWGTRRFLGPIPRSAFRVFLSKGLRAVAEVSPDGIEAILDAADDVPYNVQLLAHGCWEAARGQARPPKLTQDFVDAVNQDLAHRNDPLYAQLWNGLTPAQQKALLAIIHEGGARLASSRVARRFGVPVTTMQKALQALTQRQLIREEGTGTAARLRLEDPLLGTWVRLMIVVPTA